MRGSSTDRAETPGAALREAPGPPAGAQGKATTVADRSGGLQPQGSRKNDPASHLAAALPGTSRESAERIRAWSSVGLHLLPPVRIGPRRGLGPEMGQSQGIGSWPGLNPRCRLGAPGRGSRVRSGCGPPGGQRTPEFRQGLPGAPQGEASGDPRLRRRRRGKGGRRREDRGEEDHDRDEAAMRPGHRGLSFSQRRPPRRPGWSTGRLQGLKVRQRAGGSVELTDETSVEFENFDRPLTT